MCGGVGMLNTTFVTLYLSGANSVWRSRHVEHYCCDAVFEWSKQCVEE